jgi:DnaK suppressor protein
MSHPPTRHLSDEVLHRLRAMLVHKRDQLIAAKVATERDRRGIADPEIETGDVAEGIIEQESALRVGAFDAALLADVERALHKIEDGTYGTSELSGEPISLERLEAIPWARRGAHEEAPPPR